MVPYTSPVHNSDTGKWCVYKQNPDGSRGELVGCSDTLAEAEAHLRALHANADKSDFWVTVEQMKVLCPGCAEDMQRKGLDRVNLAALATKQGDETLRRMCDSVGSDPGVFSRCMERGLGGTDITNREGFCAELHRVCTGHYPGADSTPDFAKSLPDDALIALGDSELTRIKTVGEGRIGGYLVVWGSPAQKDLQGEYFTPDTDLGLADYDGTLRALYHHGLDDALKAATVGVIDTLTPDDTGVWAEAQLNLRNRYIAALQKLVQRGVLQWSSGSLPHLVQVGPGGKIVRWPIVEGSLTPAPAEPRKTGITNLKALQGASAMTSLRGLAAKAGLVIDEPGREEDSSNKSTEVSKMNPEQLIAAAVDGIAAALGVQVSEEQKKAIVAQVMKQMQQGQTPEAQAAMSAPITEPNRAAEVAKQIAPHVMKAVGDIVAAQKAAEEQARQQQVALTTAVADATKSALNAANGQGGISQLGGMRDPRNARITEVRDERFDHLDAPEMALGFLMLRGLNKEIGEDFVKAMAYKTAQRMERNDPAATDLAVKSVFPFDKPGDVMAAKFVGLKANEVMGVGQSGFGQEYVPTYYSTDVWQIVRQQTLIYDRMRALGMDEQEVPQGYKSDTVPLEGADMDWFNAGSGATDMDASSGRATPVTATSKFATGNKEVTLGRLTARTFWQQELDQDSIVNILAEANRKIKVSAKEQVENVCLNGDTDVTASTNINLIDGTPAAAPNKPSYTLFNGLLKLPLVTNTANRYDALNTLSEKIYLALLPLLGTLGKGASDPDKILFVVDNPTYFASLNLAVLKTQDVFPNATVVEGVLRKIWGVELLRSAQLVLANSVGKVPSGGGTLGRIGLVRPDQWAARWKRKLEIFTEFDKDAYVTSLAAHMRLGLGFRDNEASACAVNVNTVIV